MSANVGSSEQNSVQSIKQVGGVRAYRLGRDLGITTPAEVCNSSPAELMQITSIGPVRAKEIFADAKEKQQEWRAANPTRKEHRVAVVAGQDVFDDLHNDIRAGKLVDDALDHAGISKDGDTRVGHLTNGDMGGDAISTWLSLRGDMGSNLMRQMFETPWSKYSRILDPLRHVDDDWLEANNVSEADDLPAGRMPDRPSLDDIPFDVQRDEQIEWWMAPAERTARMVSWADEVVIVVDGEYADAFRRQCEYQNVDCTTVFQLKTVIRGENQTRDNVPIFWTPDEDDTHDWEATEEEATRGERGPREGSVPDLASDDHFRDGPNDVSEDRVENDPNDLTKADAGGTGVGSKMGRWG